MYNENRGSLKSTFIKIILVVVIIFVLMFLFPTKGFITNQFNKENKVIDNFNTNLLNMATVASGYFTGSRLPKDTDEKVTLTLGEMLKDKMLVPFTDSNNKVCNNKKSYVEVTKTKDDYTMKVNLSCSDKEDYILLHMGLDQTSFPSTSTERCEYLKNLEGYWTDWSNWSNKWVKATENRQVQTTTKKVQTSTKTVSQKTVNTVEPNKYIINGVRVVYVCPSGYDNAGSHESYTKCTKTNVTYKDSPVYSNVTYYRYRDKVENKTDTKWSNCNDENLLNQGYELTGKKEQKG